MKTILLGVMLFLVTTLATAQSVNVFLISHDASGSVPGSSELNKVIDNAARPELIKPMDPRVNKRGILRDKSRYFVSSLISDEVNRLMIEKTDSADQRVARQAKSLFIKADVERLFETIYSPMGLKQNDLADATAAYWIMMWMIGNQRAYPPMEQARKIRNQAYDSLSASGMLQLPDSKKQKLAQVYMWKAILAYMSLEDPRTDRRQLAALVNQRTQMLGFEFQRTVLTQEGFLLPKK